jgi:hypothetical protein
MYTVYMLFFEMALLSAVTVISFLYLRGIKKEQNLSIPTWILFSNPIATGLMSFFAGITIVMVAVGQSQIEADIVYFR